MKLRALASHTTTAPTSHHTAPTGWFLALLILLALIYIAWRTGRLRNVRSSIGRLRLRGELRGVRIRPMALLPLALLLIVIAVLVINHLSGSGVRPAGR